MAKNFQKKETTRRKPDPKIFRKHFAKFEEAIEGLREADTAIADIFAKDVDGEAVSEPIDSPKDAIMASDGAINSIEIMQIALQNRISGIIQPMGAKKDFEITACADKYEISMVSTGLSHLS